MNKKLFEKLSARIGTTVTFKWMGHRFSGELREVNETSIWVVVRIDGQDTSVSAITIEL